MPINLCRFYDVWQAAREANRGGIPHRHQLGLPQLRALTSNLMIYERVASGNLQIKMSGTNLDAQFGRNLTGACGHEMAEPEANAAMTAFHQALIDHPAGGHAQDILVNQVGKRVKAEYLILPLLNREGKRIQFASMCEAETQGFGQPADRPGTRITYNELLSARHLDIGFGIPDYNFLITTKTNSMSEA
ncbi:PAS domain-containing protein [Kordiimonas sp.]|uniref:PAS domain-containing protein n=1 Tax=Kordiimonas sp. TaxID=1970157 RepID=UPI003A94CFD7